jgi:hypothetical protein
MPAWNSAAPPSRSVWGRDSAAEGPLREAGSSGGIRAPTGPGTGQHPGAERWRRGESRDLEDVPLVEGLSRQQGFGEGVDMAGARSAQRLGQGADVELEQVEVGCPAGEPPSGDEQELGGVSVQDSHPVGRAEAETLDDATRPRVAHVEAVVAAEQHPVGPDGLDEEPERARRVRDGVVREPPEIRGDLAPGTVAGLASYLLAAHPALEL